MSSVRVYYFPGSPHYYLTETAAAEDGGPVRSCSAKSATTHGMSWHPADKEKHDIMVLERQAHYAQTYKRVGNTVVRIDPKPLSKQGAKKAAARAHR